MIRLSKAPVPFPIPWGENTHFMIRPGDIIERGELEADLAEHRAGRVFDFQLNEAFEAGVAALLAERPEDIERIREAVAAEADGEVLSPEDQAGLETARDAVRSSWPAYRILLSQAARRSELIPTLSFQRFCTGWEGEGLPAHKAGPDGLVDLDVMGKIPPIVVRLVGMRAYQMLYAAGEEGNSEPLLPPVKSPRPFKSGTPKEGGTSPKRSGPKTRSSS